MRPHHTPSRRELLTTGALVASGIAGFAHLDAAAPPRPASLPHAKPQDMGLDANRLQVAYDLMDRWSKGKNPAIPGGVILVGRQGKIVPPRFFGRQGPEASDPPIRKDSLFCWLPSPNPSPTWGP